jgi:hypothetical protein
MGQEVLTTRDNQNQRNLVRLPLQTSGNFVSRSFSRLVDLVPIGGAFQPKPEEFVEPGIVRDFDGRAGVATGLYGARGSALKDRATEEAGLVKKELVKAKTRDVLVLPLVPRKTFPGWYEEFKLVSSALAEALANKHKVKAQIIPEPVQPVPDASQESFLQTMGATLTEARRYGEPSLSVVAIAREQDTREILSHQPGFDGSEVDKKGASLLVLEHPEEAPADTMRLTPVRAAPLLEAGPPQPKQLL